jgi:YVTN family beta-propeller protein
MTTRPSRRAAIVATLLSIAFLLLSSGPVTAAARAAPGPLTVVPSPSPAVPRTGGTSLSGFVEQTLDLLNGTLVAGNSLPFNSYEPEWIQFNPADGMVYVLSNGGTAAPNLQVVNASTDTVVGAVALGGSSAYTTALDPAVGDLLVSDPAAGDIEVVNTTFDRIVGNISVGNDPQGLAVDPSNGLVYVLNQANNGSGNVSVVNLTAGNVTAWIPVGSGPGAIAFDSADQELFVSNGGSSSVSVVNTSLNVVNATLPVGNDPGAIAVDSGTDTVYVLNNYPSTNISVLNGSSNTVLGSISLGSFGSGGAIALDVSSSHLYVTLPSPNDVGVISTLNDTLFVEDRVGDYPAALIDDPPIGAVAVLNEYSANVSVISTATSLVLGSVPVASNPGAVAVDPVNGTLYLPDTGADALEVVNGTALSVVAVVSVGLEPAGTVYDPANGNVYTAELDAGAATVVNGSSDRIVATIPTGAGAGSVAVDPNGSRVFVVNSGAGTVTSINSSTDRVAGTTVLGGNPSRTVWDGADGKLFVVNPTLNNVSVLNGSTGTLLANIPVTADPDGLAFDPSNGEVYVQSGTNGRVSVISTSTDSVTANVTLGGGYPYGILYDPAANDVRVLTVLPNFIKTISGSTNTVVGTVNLSSGSETPNGMAIDPTTGTIFVDEIDPTDGGRVVVLNGSTGGQVAAVGVGTTPGPMFLDPADGVAFIENTFSYNLSVLSLSNDSLVATIPVGAGIDGATWDPYSDSVFFTNSGQGTMSIVNPPGRYELNFTETGLPGATEWSVTVDGVTHQSAGRVLSFGVRNGSATYAVGPVPGFLGSPAGGTVFVNGSNVNQTIVFDPTYSVNFNETGLPFGTSWGLTLNGTTERSTNTSLVFQVSNGTYPYNVSNVPGWRASAYAGTVPIAGANVTVDLRWTLSVYPVNFSASGLPIGRSWAVLVNGTLNRTTTGSAGFDLPNGTYNYSVAGAPGYAPVPASGSVTVNGVPQTLVVNFTAGFLVQFNESGLSPGTYWAVTLNGSLNFSVTSSIGFEVPNGDFGYVLANVPGWRTSAYTGQLSVHGGNQSVDISWNRTEYTVGFNELGLPLATTWSVSIGNETSAGSVSALFLSEPNGSYTFSVANVAGWRASEYSGPVNVSGGDVDVTLYWTENVFPVTLTESGLPTGTEWSAAVNGGAPTYSTGGTIVFPAGNGTVAYTIGAVAGYRADQYSGDLNVNDGPAGATVTWTAETYTVNVTEVGLPVGTSWAITYGGVTTRSSTASIQLSAPNGTATFNVSNVPGWRADGYNVTVQVAGGPATDKVLWSPTTYTVTLTATGLAAGGGWTAVVNGTSYASTGPTVTVSALRNGTYPLSVPVAGGQSASGVPATVTVSGAPVTLTVSFGPASSTSSSSSLGLAEIGVGVAIAVVVVALLAWVLLRRRRPPASSTPEATEEEAPADTPTILPDPPR